MITIHPTTELYSLQHPSSIQTIEKNDAETSLITSRRHQAQQFDAAGAHGSMYARYGQAPTACAHETVAREERCNQTLSHSNIETVKQHTDNCGQKTRRRLSSRLADILGRQFDAAGTHGSNFARYGKAPTTCSAHQTMARQHASFETLNPSSMQTLLACADSRELGNRWRWM